MTRYNHPNIGDVQDHVFIKGVITAIDSATDLVSVIVEGGVTAENVPLYYHCDEDSTERTNGAIEGAASGFNEDDEVVVMCSGQPDAYVPVRVVARVDGIATCGWQEVWGTAICDNHKWILWPLELGSIECPTLPFNQSNLLSEMDITLVNGVLRLEIQRDPGFGSPSSVDLDWDSSVDDFGGDVGTMVLKVSDSSNLTHGDEQLTLSITQYGGPQANFVIAKHVSYNPTPPYYYIGDNGGIEMNLNLLNYGFSSGKTIYKIRLWCYLIGDGSMVDVSVDYIKFQGL